MSCAQAVSDVVSVNANNKKKAVVYFINSFVVCHCESVSIARAIEPTKQSAEEEHGMPEEIASSFLLAMTAFTNTASALKITKATQ